MCRVPESRPRSSREAAGRARDTNGSPRLAHGEVESGDTGGDELVVGGARSDVGRVLGAGAGARPAAAERHQRIAGRLAGLMALFSRLCVGAGLPEPVPEFRFDPRRRWRMDWAWPLEKVALEVEGAVFNQGRHTRGIGYIRDMEKYSEAAIAGWCVVRCTPGQLMTVGLDRVIRALAQRLVQRRNA